MSATMTESRTNKDKAPKEAVGQGAPFSLRPSPEVRDIVDGLAARARRTRNQMMLILIEEALTARGLYKMPPIDS